MHEDELRALIRDAVARHLGNADDRAPAFANAPAREWRAGPTGVDFSHVVSDGRAGIGDGRAGCPNPAQSWKSHHSHGRFVFLAPTDPDAPCVVEPQVRCHHCGFCQSYGN